MTKTSKNVSVVVAVVGLTVASAASMLRPSSSEVASVTHSEGATTASGLTKTSPGLANLQPSAAGAAAPAAQRLTLEQLRNLEPAELAREAAEVDEEIARGRYIERANASTLAGADYEQFRTLLRQRNAVQIAKAERLIAALDAKSSR